MEKTLRSCADQIVEASIRAVLPDEAVRRALKDFHPEGRTVLVAAGKAAWQMAHAAVAVLGHVDGGVVVTKYNHVKGKIPGVTCCEAGHPVPDANSFAATQKALELVLARFNGVLENAFDELGVKKLPSVKSLQEEYAKLLAEKKAAYAEYRRSRDEMRELLLHKQNVDRMLGKDEGSEEKKQEHDRQ